MIKNVLNTDIYAITDSKLSLNRNTIDVVKELLKADVKLIQYREKYKKMGEMLKECLEISRLCKESGACFIVNDHVDIAILSKADGVHIGQEDLPVSAIRQLLGETKIIGLSTHSPKQALEAEKLYKDGLLNYIGVGPIFPTKTKVDVCEAVGFEYLEYVVQNCTVPFVAIGGIKKHNLAEVIKHGAKCCALVSEIVSAQDIPAQIKEIRTIFQGSKK
ncbi:thiamine phosphate synthase [Desulfovibrio litoralis]|uniref:Thiamine-phosphate synthase n=1 Tax=Desulfovibrio litoralis DSM 11393 TaxID=1121455 RepID=A0A1M7RZN6_9BACT|nr:thiamine phosphate synthase [Desulfovibrio litoralis]SHN51552.1 thiamine-phosphate diphosphorylase [Desulfovibrio litoralis DSM 11393]